MNGVLWVVRICQDPRGCVRCGRCRRRGCRCGHEKSGKLPSTYISVRVFTFAFYLSKQTGAWVFFLVPAARWVVKNSKAFGARRVEVLRGGALENGAHWSHGGDTSCGTALASYFPHARVPFGLLFLVDLGIGQEF